MRAPSVGQGLIAAVAIVSLVTLYGAGPGTSIGDIPTPRRAGPRPDIVLVTIDALRKDHVSTYGYRRLTTPAIDRFSDTAVTFTTAITQAPYTKAAIASLMSGLYPSSHKAVTATVPFGETMTGHPATPFITTDILSDKIVTLAERLQASGYHTLGFTGNPFLIAPFGYAQGFDTFEFFPGSGFADANQIVSTALAQVQHSGTKPLFLWVHLMEPHSPYAPPPWTAGAFRLTGRPYRIPSSSPPPPWLLKGSPPDLRLYEQAYDEDILAADTAVDTLLRGLNDLRDLTNTVVVLTADHGEQFLDHDGWEHNDTLYDELIRVPLVIRAPGTTPGVVRDQVQIVDLYPTLLEYAGADLPTDVPGRVLALQSGGDLQSEPAFSEISGVQYAVRTDDWKLIMSVNRPTQLFDLHNDARERHNVAEEKPAEVERLQRQLDRWLAAAVERGSTISPESAPINPHVLERLRALGYLGK